MLPQVGFDPVGSNDIARALLTFYYKTGVAEAKRNPLIYDLASDKRSALACCHEMRQIGFMQS